MDMLHLLFAIIFLEAAATLSLVFKTPARKLVIVGLDRIKRGRGPLIAKSVACMVLAVFSFSLNTAFNIWRKAADDADPHPTDLVLMTKHLLEASLMGFFLFLALLTDRLHFYIRELRVRGRTTEAVRKHGGSFGGLEEIQAREEQVGSFKDIVRQLQSELDSKTKELVAADSKIDAMKKQSAVMLSDYDRLLSLNHDFRGQLQSMELRLSSSVD